MTSYEPNHNASPLAEVLFALIAGGIIVGAITCDGSEEYRERLKRGSESCTDLCYPNAVESYVQPGPGDTRSESRCVCDLPKGKVKP